MEKIRLPSLTDRNFLFFDDRFYVISREIIEQALKKGEKINSSIKKLLSDTERKDFYFPSSTSILGASPKPYLAKWRGSVGNMEADRIIAEALKKGSSVHTAIDCLLRGGEIGYKPLLKPEEIEELSNKNFVLIEEQQEFLELYRLGQWFEAVNPLLLASEFTVISLKHFYGGTLDALLKIEEGEYLINGSKPLRLKEGIYIIDYKTGNSFDKKNYYRQVASYGAAVEEEGEYLIKGALIIHTNDNKVKSGIEGLKTYYVSKKELNRSFNEFLRVKKVYELDLNYKPTIIELPALLSIKK